MAIRMQIQTGPGAAGMTALTSLSKLTRLVLDGKDGYGIAELAVKARALADTAVATHPPRICLRSTAGPC